MTPTSTGTPAERLLWMLRDVEPQLEALAVLERQGRCDRRLAHDVAAQLASASGAAGQLEAQHLYGVRQSARGGR